MQEGDYRTSVIGKWHVGSHLQSYMPYNQGFDHSFIGIAGIYLDHSDTVRSNPKTRLSGYYGKSVNVLFEFDLGTTSKDTLKVYLNPGRELPAPAAVFDGEFTFDRLQFALAGRGGSNLTVDDVRIGIRLKDVCP